MKKRICVIGLGLFGKELAVNLAKTEEVLVLDIKQNSINLIAEKVQRALRLDTTNYSDLSSVVDSSFDEVIVSVGEDLETSILTVLHLKKIGIKKIHAKALSDDHARILEALGADNIVFPESEAANRLCKRIINPNVLEDMSLGVDYTMVELAVPDEFVGKSVGELEIRKQYSLYLIAIRDIESGNAIFMPEHGQILDKNMSLVLIGKVDSIDKIRLLGREE